MPRIPLTFAQLKQIGRLAAEGWVDDNASSMGAAIAYYTMLSLAPLLLIVITTAGLIFGEEAARGALFGELAELVGDNGAQAIQAILISSSELGSGLISILIGLVTLFIGATTVFAELQSDLDRIWKAPVPKHGGVLGFLRKRLLSFGMILGIGFMLIVSLVASAAIAAVGTLWNQWLMGTETLLQVLNFFVGFAVITGLFALIYKLLPSVPIAWSDVGIGAAVTSLLFSAGKFLIGLYLGKAAISSSFGAAGTLVVVIVWVYYSAQIFLFGAEFTYHFARERGSRS
ncbi:MULTISPECIES: YihY/virulence factor BrkB family protein [Hydrocarboniphaga]|uniref:Putative ribonuclease RNase BN (RBN) transmembrane protein n=2 Tax=Gammaproteobacteria TaxID=1236 RepID=I8TE07_9GAMM|nr:MULTISPECIES: YihY/virulence factor BrkB family protein [Hydrocarboniphaga]EIT72215.1 putative ribonuclease RNase BN (RBN) transmembrane protein [Hydrocarboniphaga effusa AP103]MDZ4079651.1 YihY/virulence factor BrkB family protein [Hydrocarboniphaga sp.]